MLNELRRIIIRVLKNEKGQGMVEYALIIGLVAVVLVLVLTGLGTSIQGKFQAIIDALK